MQTASLANKDNVYSEAIRNTDVLVDQAVQLYELDAEKASIIDQFYESFRTITEFLSFSIELPAEIFNSPSDSQFTLTPTLDVVLKKSNNREEKKRLDEYSVEVISSIIEHVVPAVVELAQIEKENQNQNITFLREVTRILSKIKNINNQTEDTDNASTNNTADPKAL